MSRARTLVVGVGMTRFEKPGGRDWDYPDMVREAATAALEDASLDYADITQAYAGYVYGDSASGQRGIYELGLTGIPVVNVNNNCATGSSALYLGNQAVRGGLADCVLVVGFERMAPGSLTMAFPDRTSPIDRHLEALRAARGEEADGPLMPWFFSSAGHQHMQRYGSTPDHFAWIAWKNHAHSVDNPYAQFRDSYSLDEIKAARVVSDPLTKLQCSPTSDGAAAAILASERFVDDHGLWDRAVELAGQAMTTDVPGSFGDDMMRIVGAEMTRAAAEVALDDADATIDDVDVIELHDCFSVNELITYEALGMAEEGAGHRLVEREETTHGGRWVVNPSGGLISKGHPLGATGLAQCAELTWQLRGEAGGRQVDGATIGLQHNLGLGGACVVGVYRRVAA